MEKVVRDKIKKISLFLVLTTFVFIILAIYAEGINNILKILLFYFVFAIYFGYSIYNVFSLYKNNKIIEYKAICVDIKKPIPTRKYFEVVFYIKTEEDKAEIISIQRNKGENFIKEKEYFLYFIKDKPLNQNNFIGLSLGEFKE